MEYNAKDMICSCQYRVQGEFAKESLFGRDARFCTQDEGIEADNQLNVN